MTPFAIRLRRGQYHLYISNGWIDLDAGFSSKNRNAFPYDWRFGATLALEDSAAGKQRDRRHRRCQTHRSEEHTSELQSLMRISYAVFCLKKKKTKNNKDTTSQHQQTNRINYSSTIRNQH